MNYTEIINKLIGDIKPIGETNTDIERFENLQSMCQLVENLIIQIDEVAVYNKNSNEFSMKKAGKFADNFLTKKLGIVNY